MKAYQLPKNLLLGAATASAQIEGGYTNHSWRNWEKRGKLRHDSSFSRACDHWERWKEDVDLMAAMGLETYRFSIEWARIEPREGCFDRQAIRRYREEILGMLSAGIRPCLTLHHFTNPMWFENRGGFRNPANAKLYLRYVAIAVRSFGDLVSDYVTFNEPNVYAFMGYGGQGWPPGSKNVMAAFRVLSVMAGCHIRAYRKIHRMRRAMGLAGTRVGIALHMRAFAPMNPDSGVQKTCIAFNRLFFQDLPARAFLLGQFRKPMENLGGFIPGIYCDYLGINYYTRNHVLLPVAEVVRPRDPKNDYGWEIYPQGLSEVMRELYRICPKPVWILENGTCDEEDRFRSLFIYDHLEVLSRTEVPVERYYHWSFLDNFEWLDGESKRFGLVHVDFETQERRVKKSGHFYREIIHNHGVTHDMTERYLSDERYHR